MANVHKNLVILSLVLVWVTIFPSDAYAYLDPGTGSLIIQSVIAALAAAAYALKLYWTRIRLFFTRRENPADSDTEQRPAG